MTDLRARLADALRDHDVWHCEGWMPTTKWAEHLADVLLSLPGIAIVDAACKKTEWRARIDVTKIYAPDEDWARRSLAQWDKNGIGCVESRTVIETPWLLAAANATEGEK